MTWDIFSVLLTMFGSFSALNFWLMNRLEIKIHSDLDAIGKRLDATNLRIDAMGARIDAMGARIDTTQSIIMKILEKQGK